MDISVDNGMNAWAFAAVETLVCVVLVSVAVRAFGRLLDWIRAEGRLGAVRLRTFTLLSAGKAADTAAAVVRVLRAITIGVILYSWFTVILSTLPATRPFGVRLASAVRDAASAVWTGTTGYLPNFVEIVLIFLLARYLIRALRYVFDALESGRLRWDGFDAEWTRPTYQIARFLVIVFALVTIFPLLPGHDSKALQGVTIFVGVLFSFASSASGSSLVAGLILVLLRSFRKGDWIQSGDTFGEVYERNLFVTRIRTVKNVEVTVPNAVILNSHTQNFSQPAGGRGLILHTTVSIGYDTPWRKVHELLLDAARRTGGVESGPEPFVLQKSLNDFYVTYELNAFTRRPDRIPAAYSELHQNIQDAFFAAGVEILSPHYTSIRDGNSAAIPSEQRPKGYVPPPFRIKTGD